MTFRRFSTRHGFTGSVRWTDDDLRELGVNVEREKAERAKRPAPLVAVPAPRPAAPPETRKRADELAVGDVIRNGCGEWRAVTSVEVRGAFVRGVRADGSGFVFCVDQPVAYRREG